VVAFGDLASITSDSRVRLQKLDTPDNQFELFKKLYSSYERVFILESLVGPKELAEISIIGFDPEIIVACDSNKFMVTTGQGKIIKESRVAEPLAQLRELVPRINDDQFRYVGGAVGYVSYDAIRFWEQLHLSRTKKGPNFPLFEFGIHQDGIIYDHKKNQAYYFYWVKSRLQELQHKINTSKNVPLHFTYSRPLRNMTKAHYIKMVKKAKRLVYDGDVFQVVLAKSMKFRINGSIINYYKCLREVNPSPYMYLLKMSERCIVGSSPEMLIRVTKDYVETFPIAGTRPVVEDQKKNEELRHDLLKDEKELAEHTMLVDLARNDIGRVCKFGTVRVNDLMTVKQFSHVQHIVSHVVGKLSNNYDAYDALKAVFPAGTVSGAPKVRAMEVIEELEPTFRGPYAGALGYFSFNGSCDFAITIRSIFLNKNDAYLESGAGIVMDSDPEAEWLETEHKANALLTALEKASA
jgi:anthranilate synthase component 1